ncbi:MAG: hypothetical protein LBI65_03080, partial [Candidatus Symbiothrix sp.]|nr:hypothetical protein [Candidatus Symbiothrix sp.]
MKALFIPVFFLFAGFPFRMSAQSDADAENYWILENFNDFPVTDDWIVPPMDYQTYPNRVVLTTEHANIENGFDCAYGQHALRVRGVEEGGSVSFTVANAGRVTFYITGKQKASDRGARIYMDGKLIETHDGFDRYDCIEFTRNINSEIPVTFRITGANDTKKDPFVLYFVEVQKYGVDIPRPEPPLPNYEAYWIYEDFKHFPLEMDEWGDGIYNTKQDYQSMPNEIALQTDSANIELGE